MYNLSELIKTDCCIDCGTNEKLREVVGKLTIPESFEQKRLGGVYDDEIKLLILDGRYSTVQSASDTAIPLTSINIDL